MAKFNLKDLKNAVDVGREVLPIVQPVIEKHGPAAVEQVAQKARQAGAVVVGARIRLRKRSKAAKMQGTRKRHEKKRGGAPSLTRSLLLMRKSSSKASRRTWSILLI